MAGEALYSGLAGAGEALAKGIQQYQANRQQSLALDGQLDRLASAMAGYAQRHPEVVSPQDEPLIRSIAAASGGGLSQKKAALADAMLWLESKQAEARQKAAADYQASIAAATAASQRLRQQSFDRANQQQEATQNATRDLLRSLANGAGAESGAGIPAWLPDVAAAAEQYPAADPASLLSLAGAATATKSGAQWNLQPGQPIQVPGTDYVAVPSSPNSVTFLSTTGEKAGLDELVGIQRNLTGLITSINTPPEDLPNLRKMLDAVNQQIAAQSGLNLGGDAQGGNAAGTPGLGPVRKAVWDPKTRRYILTPRQEQK